MAKKEFRRLNRNKFFLLLIFIFLFLIYGYLPLLVKQAKLSKLITCIEREIVKLEESNRLLEEEKRKLTTDLSYVDRLAREKLDLLGSREILYKIVEKKSRGGAAR